MNFETQIHLGNNYSKSSVPHHLRDFQTEKYPLKQYNHFLIAKNYIDHCTILTRYDTNLCEVFKLEFVFARCRKEPLELIDCVRHYINER